MGGTDPVAEHAANESLPEITPDRDPSASEARLGLVLYGGVSLAIYIYGVAFELWRLVKASRGEKNEYFHLLKDSGVSATVDIISGASAGGLNGVLLGKALTSNADLRSIKNVWTDTADLSELLRDRDDTQARSLLKSKLFADELRKGLERLDRSGDGPPLVKVLDVFVAATRLNGRIRTYTDDLNQTVQTLDFRKIFHLKFRTRGFNEADPTLGYPRNDFAKKNNRVLVQIARSSAAFPGAFEPELVGRATADKFLSADEPESSFFSDGGILHNKPFTETIDTIFARESDRPVDRWLFSVEPDPESLTVEEAVGNPQVSEVVVKAVTSIPRYQSIATDLDRLRAHRGQVATIRALIHDVDEFLVANYLDQINADDETFDEFLASQVLFEPYLKMRREAFAIELAERLSTIAGIDESDQSLVLNGVRDFAGARLAGLDPLDFRHEINRTYHLINRLPTPGPGEPARLHNELWAQFERLNDLAWHAIEGNEVLRTALSKAGQQNLASTVQEQLTIIAPTLESDLASRTSQTASIAAEADGPPVLNDNRPYSLQTFYECFQLWDMFVLPVQKLSGVRSLDPVRFVRISPEAATFIRKTSADKLAGDQLGHFGGFLDRRWRINDIMWGRLDCAEVIVRTLLSGGHPTGDGVAEKIRCVQEPIAREELGALGFEVPTDYKAFLENEYQVGSENIGSLDFSSVMNLAFRAANVFRNMMNPLQEDAKRPAWARSVPRVLGRILGTLLLVLRWPFAAAFGPGGATKRIGYLVLTALLLWSVLTFVLMMIGAVPWSWAIGKWVLVFAGIYILFLGLTLLLRHTKSDG
jgi:predicted acylesterase/phospholipase RssA